MHKHKIGDRFRSKYGVEIYLIEGFQGGEYLLVMEGDHWPSAVDEGHLEEYYDKIESQEE